MTAQANEDGFPTALWGSPSSGSYNSKRVVQGQKGLHISSNLTGGDQTKNVLVETLLEAIATEQDAFFNPSPTPNTAPKNLSPTFVTATAQASIERIISADLGLFTTAELNLTPLTETDPYLDGKAQVMSLGQE